MAQGGDRRYFYQIFMGGKQPIPLQDSKLFYKAEKKNCWRLFGRPGNVVIWLSGASQLTF